MGGVSYPLFWIDLSKDNSIDYHEDRLTGHRESARDDIRRYCEAFYDEHNIYTHRPFIESLTEQQISQKPDWWDELHGNLVKNFHLPDDSKSEGPAEEDLGTARPVAEAQWSAIVKDFLTNWAKLAEEGAADKKVSE